MPIVNPTDITALDGITPPSTSDPTNFDPRADAFLTALPTLQSQINTTADQTYSNALDALTSATQASTSAASASASASAAAAASVTASQYAGSTAWTSGSYASGAVVFSPISGLVYRRKSPGGASPTDPANDPANWNLATVAAPRYYAETATTVTGVINAHHMLMGVLTQNVVLPTSGLAAGDILWISVANGLDTNYLTLGGNKVNGEVQDGNILILDDAYAVITLRWTGSTYGWSI